MLREDLWESLLHLKEILLAELDDVAKHGSSFHVCFFCVSQAGGREALQC